MVNQRYPALPYFLFYIDLQLKALREENPFLTDNLGPQHQYLMLSASSDQKIIGINLGMVFWSESHCN